MEGEWVIYTGSNLWWGHGEKDQRLDLHKWFEIVAKWNGNSGAEIGQEREYPKVGLNEDKPWEAVRSNE
jgi:hypothetical protein